MLKLKYKVTILTMKKCSACKKIKDLTMFGKLKSQPDGLNYCCKDCCNKSSRKRYEANKTKSREYLNKRKHKTKTQTREYVKNYLLKNSCVICGQSDIRCLEFDHINPSTKKYNVCKMITNGLSIESIKEEIAKCRVLCANCHAIHTSNQNKDYKYKHYNP